MKLKCVISLISGFTLSIIVTTGTLKAEATRSNAPVFSAHEQRVRLSNDQRIMPRDILSLASNNHATERMVKPVKKLTPTARLHAKTQVTTVIPLQTISAFLSSDHIIDAALVKNAPRILGDSVGSPRFFTEDIFYAEGQYDKNNVYGIYRLGELYRSKTGEILGSALTFIGHAEVSTSNQVRSTSVLTAFDLTKSVREAQQGDLLLAIPELESLPAYFVPTAVNKDVKGYILKALNNADIIGELDVVVIDKGKRDHINIGSMFSILRSSPELFIDTNNIIYQQDGNVFEKMKATDLQLPAQRVGQLMVFKVYEKASMAIVIRANAVINANDKIEGFSF